MSYFTELCAAMNMLGEQPSAIFMGQGVAVQGTTLTDTFSGVPAEKKLEMPVAEDMQMGMAIGMALEGFLPVCVFPRWNFLLIAANQLVNHLDRLPLYSDGGYRPKVIIRTAAPSKVPFDPGPQHDDDFSAAFRWMMRTINVVELREEDRIVPCYTDAVKSSRSTLLVEYTDRYRDERSRK